jgi:hypothetical protein
MLRRPLQHLVLATLVSLAAASQAAAGSCCGGCGTPCVAPGQYIPVAEVVVVTPMYVVNQGPTYVGPGVMTYPHFFNERRPPADYPYVSHDYPQYQTGYRGYQAYRVRHSQRVKTVSYRSYRQPLHPRDK